MRYELQRVQIKYKRMYFGQEMHKMYRAKRVAGARSEKVL